MNRRNALKTAVGSLLGVLIPWKSRAVGIPHLKKHFLKGKVSKRRWLMTHYLCNGNVFQYVAWLPVLYAKDGMELINLEALNDHPGYCRAQKLGSHFARGEKHG